jgi:hypothetical protein
MYSIFYLRRITRASVSYYFYRLFRRLGALRDVAGVGFDGQPYWAAASLLPDMRLEVKNLLLAR